ncbi:hypothetical protein ACFQ0B_55710 [Nonomuraea thailandensis]
MLGLIAAGYAIQATLRPPDSPTVFGSANPPSRRCACSARHWPRRPPPGPWPGSRCCCSDCSPG